VNFFPLRTVYIHEGGGNLIEGDAMKYVTIPLLFALAAFLLPLSCRKSVSPDPGKMTRAQDPSEIAKEARAGQEPVPAREDLPVETAQAGAFRISGPYAYHNLALFLIHGEDTLGKEMLTLQEAIEQKKAIVHETENVSELTIENVSDTEEVFIQAGDIVRGGKQDRVLSVDMVVPPRSGRIPVASFCVEQGRWSKRGRENAWGFGGSVNYLASNSLKVAAKRTKRQEDIWKEVGALQGKLNSATGMNVADNESRSSLELTMENRNVRAAISDYRKHLSDVLQGKEDVIGFAFATNGEFNCAEVYASGDLFRKLWPKMFKSCLVEAVAEQRRSGKFEHPHVDAVKACFEKAEKGKASVTEVTPTIRMITRENGDYLLFETIDVKRENRWIHRNYIMRMKLGAPHGRNETDSNEDR